MLLFDFCKNKKALKFNDLSAFVAFLIAFS
jgi:hypothetical protein